MVQYKTQHLASCGHIIRTHRATERKSLPCVALGRDEHVPNASQDPWFMPRVLLSMVEDHFLAASQCFPPLSAAQVDESLTAAQL